MAKNRAERSYDIAVARIEADEARETIRRAEEILSDAKAKPEAKREAARRLADAKKARAKANKVIRPKSPDKGWGW